MHMHTYLLMSTMPATTRIPEFTRIPEKRLTTELFTSREAAGQVLAWLVVFFQKKTFVEKRDLLFFCFLVHCSLIIGVVFRYFDLYHYLINVHQFSIISINFNQFLLVSINYWPKGAHDILPRLKEDAYHLNLVYLSY